MATPFPSESELSRILAMVRKYEDLVNMVGDPQILHEASPKERNCMLR